MAVDLTQDAMALATEMVDQFNRRDLDEMIALAGGGVDYTDVATGVHVTDEDSYREVLRGWLSAFPDLRGTVTSATCDGRLLAYEIRWDGTHTGPLQTPMGPIPASGRQVSVLGAIFVGIDGDRVSEVRQHGDTLTLLSQIGAIPAQATAAQQSAGATNLR